MQRLFSNNTQSLKDLFENTERTFYRCSLCKMDDSHLQEVSSKPPKIYHPETLTELLQQEHCSLNSQCKSVLFLVRQDNKLVFAKEYTSAYFPLTVNQYPRGDNNIARDFLCVAAGIADFNEKNELIRIHNACSDELTLPHHALHFALRAIVTHNITLARQVSITKKNGIGMDTFSRQEILDTYAPNQQPEQKPCCTLL